MTATKKPHEDLLTQLLKQLGQVFTQKREDRGLSQKSVTTELGTKHEDEIAMIEVGFCEHLAFLAQLAHFYGVDFQKLDALHMFRRGVVATEQNVQELLEFLEELPQHPDLAA